MIKRLILACLLLTLSHLSCAAPKVLLLAAQPVQTGKLEMLVPLAAQQGITLDHRMLSDSATVTIDELKDYNFLMIDAAYGPAVMMLQQQLLPSLKSTQLPWLWLRRDGNQSQQLTPDLIQSLDLYYSNGGQQNYQGYFCTLAAHLNSSSDSSCVEPKIYPEHAIYHPQANSDVFSSFEQYLAFKQFKLKADTPVIGILFHKSYMDSGLTGSLDAAIKQLEQRGALAVPMYASAMNNGEITELVTYQGNPRLDVLLNMQIMLNADGRRDEFEAIGAPVLQVLNYHQGNQEQWQADNIGLTTQDIPFYLSQPEYAGMMDPIIVSAKTEGDNQQPIKRQLDSVINKALNLAHLKHTATDKIKTAIVFYNYPPGEKNLGASFLNVPHSLETLLAEYKKRGYDTKELTEEQLIEKLTSLLAPFYRHESLAKLVQQGNAGRLSLSIYNDWFKTLPQSLQEDINQRWGEPEQASLFINYKGNKVFAIPALSLGKQVIMPQPPRSEREEDKERQLYHDTLVPPSHSYLAAYLWLNKVAKVDAIVHFGTHGSAEWQPGKERGLDVYDYPLLVLGDTPILYPYIVDNIGEALQTKRRGRAVTISHNTPSFGPAGLHGELTELHDLLHEWANATEGEVKSAMADRIVHITADLSLDKDLALDLSTSKFSDTVAQLHLHLHDLALQNQPLGLAHFGSAAEKDLRLFTVQQMLGKPLLDALMNAGLLPEGEDSAEEFLVVDYEQLKNTPVWHWLDTHVRQAAVVKGSTELTELAQQGQKYWQALSNNHELDGFFTALSGRYLKTTYGGDPMKNPDSLPTGRNLYGFDPSRIPTVDAWEAGKVAAERLLEQHKAQNGEYPTKLAFTFWSVETMRHFGMLEAQAFALMGYKPVWDRGGRISGIEKISIKELGRPRVDVVISTTGLYRDHFPQVMQWLAKAADEASQLDEINNPIAINSSGIEQQLLALGMNAEDAQMSARTRIFSSDSGAYTTGLEDATLASDSFGETDTGEQDHQAGDEKLANLYLERMQFAYGPDASRWGEKSSINVYAQQLKGVQGAVLSRSSNLYGMLTTDDPFQYLGGIGLAVRHLTGTSPTLYISNLRDSNNPKAETAAGFLARDLRTRYLHPGWIKNMQKEGYSGALQVLGSANNLWGWQVVSPEIVRDDQWQEYKEVYLDDKYDLDINEWFEENHPQAQAQLIERMLEAARKEYWQTDEQTLQDLAKRYQQLAEKYDVQTDNQRFQEYAKQAAAGFGLLSAPATEQTQNSAEAQPEKLEKQQAETEQVTGQKLEKQETAENLQPTPFDFKVLAGLLLVLLSFSTGAIRQKIGTQHADLQIK